MTLGPGSTELVLAFADDEHLIGQHHTEWIGIAPFLEEDLAITSIAQGELGHAARLYELLTHEIDTLAFFATRPRIGAAGLLSSRAPSGATPSSGTGSTIWPNATAGNQSPALAIPLGMARSMPDVAADLQAGRTERTEHFARVHADITEVLAIEPKGQW